MKHTKGGPLKVDSAQYPLFEDKQQERSPQKADIIILPPQDVMETLRGIKQAVTTTILDPWGFPEIVYKILDYLPTGFTLVAWLTWYYKNCPSVIRGWRSAQLACLHIAKPSAKLYPEHFLSGAQLEKQRQGKLRYIPGPPSVIEAPLLVGFVGRSEQVGHPAQKPIKVIEPLVLMTTKEGDTVLDPMCGSGTTGVVCKKLGRRAILCDESEEYIRMTEKRLKLHRVDRNAGSNNYCNAI